MSVEIDNIAKDILKELHREAKGSWTDPNAKYYSFRHLQIDKRGSFGERCFEELYLKAFRRRAEIKYQDGDQGDWDIQFNGFKFEVKTSSIDVNNKFQNEGLKEKGIFDGVLFLCVTPNNLYFKCVRKDNIPFGSLHNRQKAGTGSGHKWDFKINDLKELDSVKTFKTEFLKEFPEFKKLK